MHGCVATTRWANPVEPRSKNKKAGVWVVHRSTVLVVVVIVVVAAAVAVVVVVASGVFAVPSSRHSLLLWGGGGGAGWGVITTSRTISPKKPFVLTIPSPKQCNLKALRPHNPKPEAVQPQNIPNGLRLPARSSAIPNMPSSSQSQTLNLNKTGSPKQCNPEPSSSRRPAEAVQCETSNSRRPAARNSSSPRLQPERAYQKIYHSLTEPCTWILKPLTTKL